MKKILAVVLCVLMVLSLAACSEEAKLYEKYADIIMMLEAEDYTAVMGVVSQMAVEKQYEGKERPQPAKEVVGSWYLTETDYQGAPESITLREDGTCVIDGKELLWLERESGDTYLGAVIMDGGEYKYYFNIDIGEKEQRMLYVDLWTCHVEGEWVGGDKHVGMYMNDSQANLPMVYWEKLEGSENFDDYFSINTHNVWYNDNDYAWKITSAEGAVPMTIEAICTNGSDHQFSMTLDQRDGHYVLTVVDGDASALYICEEYGFETSWPEYKYPIVMNCLTRYLENGYFWVDGYEDSFEGNTALKYLLEQFTELGDYKDAAEYVSRFSMIPSQLTKVDRKTTDQLGNVSTSTLERYTYNPDGTLATVTGQNAAEQYGIYESWDMLKFEYDATGKISKINIGDYSTTGVCTPTYDEAGRIVSMDVQRTNNHYVTTFTYDEAGMLIGMDMPTSGDNSYDHYIYTYSYDDAGRLLQKTKSWYDEYYAWVYDYVYESKPLAQRIETYMYRGEASYDITNVFTSDAQGRPLSADVTTTDTSATYVARVLEYVYEDLYFFDATGIEVAED